MRKCAGCARAAMVLAILLLGGLLNAESEGNATRPSCRMPSDYAHFWDGPWEQGTPYVWNLYFVKLYDAKLHATPASLQSGEWKAEDENTLKSLASDRGAAYSDATASLRSFFTNSEKARSQHNDEKETAAELERNLSRYFATYTPGAKPEDYVPEVFAAAGRMGRDATIGNFLWVVALLNYPAKWQAYTQSQLEALSDASLAVNYAFDSAQKSADELEGMGAGNADYSGAAYKPYNDWANFAASSSRLCNGNWALQTPGTDAEKYAVAWKIADSVKQETEFPPKLPEFGLRGNGSPADVSDFVSYSLGKNRSLWEVAWEYRKSLAAAKDAMEAEYATTKYRADQKLQDAKTESGKTTTAGPEKFEGTSDYSSATSQYAFSRYSGSPKERQDLIAYDLADAERLSRDASFLSSKKNVHGYLADAIKQQQDSFYLSAMAEAGAQELDGDMQKWAGLARADAENSISSLGNSMRAMPGSGSGAAILAAKAKLDDARKYFADAEKTEDRYAGERYANYRKAKQSADAGIAALASPQDRKELQSARDALKRARELLAALEKDRICGQDAQRHRESLDALDAQVNALPDASLSISLSQIGNQMESIRAALRSCYYGDESRYAALHEKASALDLLKSGTLRSFDEQFAPLRDANGWNDAALLNMPTVQQKLSKSRETLEALETSAAGEGICKSAEFREADGSPPVAGQAFDSGGTWLAQNAYSLDIGREFSISCDLPRIFRSAELSKHSGFIDTASANGEKITVRLKSLPANAPIALEFSSIGIPVDITFGQGALVMKKDGSFSWAQNGKISAKYATPLEIVAAVPQGAHSPELSLQGVPYPYRGRIFENGNGTFASFEIPEILPSGKSHAITAKFSAPAVMERKNYAARESLDGTVAVSYLLRISGLPEADCLNATISDGQIADATAISLAADEGMVAGAEPSAGNGLTYSFRYCPILSDGTASVRVSYSFRNISALAQMKLVSLSTAVAASNNATVIDAYQKARAAYASGDYKYALELATGIENALSATMHGNATYAEEYAASLANANDFLSALTPAISGSFDKSGFGKQLLPIADKLKAQISEAEGKNSEGNAKAAVSLLNSALNDAKAKSKSASLGEYEKLEKRLVADEMRMYALSVKSSAMQKAHSDAATQLDAAKSAMIEGRPSDMLMPLIGATDALSKMEEALLATGQNEWAGMAAEAATLASRQAELSAKSNSLSSSLTSISSAKARYRPLSGASAIIQMAKDSGALVDAASSAANPKDKTDAALAAAQAKLAKANESVAKLSASLESGQAHMEEYARNTVRIASIAVEQAKNSAGVSKQDADDLASGVSALNSYLSDGNYADAIIAGEKLSDRAIAMVGKGKGGAGFDSTLLLVIITVILAAGLAYLFFMKGKKGGETVQEKKKIEKIEAQGEKEKPV